MNLAMAFMGDMSHRTRSLGERDGDFIRHFIMFLAGGGAWVLTRATQACATIVEFKIL